MVIKKLNGVLLVSSFCLLTALGSGCSRTDTTSTTLDQQKKALAGRPPTADELKAYQAKYPKGVPITPGATPIATPGNTNKR